MSRYNLLQSAPGVRPAIVFAIAEDIDLTAVQAVDLDLPANEKMILKSARIITESVDTLSNGATVNVTQYDAKLVEARVRATLTTALTGTNNDLKLTAVTKGTYGNGITLTLADPGLPNQALSVSVVSKAITVNLATSGTAQVETATAAGTITQGVAQVETATVVGTIATDGAAAVVVTAAGMTNSPKTLNVAVNNGTLQVETATVVGTIGASGAGNATVIVTAAGMSNSPKTVSVAVANNDSASTVAGKIRTALGLDADVSAFFTIGGSGVYVTLTAKAAAANDATMNISITNGTCSGLVPMVNSEDTTAGVAADNAAAVATKIRAALTADTDVGGFFTISGTGADIIATAKTAAANDATMNISVDNGTCTGLTTAATSADTTAGVAPGTGNAQVIVTGAGITGSPKTLSVAVTEGDDAATWAGKVRTALAADTDITALYTVGGSGTAITLTRTVAAANDGTLNISLDNGTCTGVTTAATSANTTAGVAGAISSTAAQVLAALQASAPAAALVTAALAAGNDGTGVVTALTATNLTGGVDSDVVQTLVDSVDLEDSEQVGNIQDLTVASTGLVQLSGGLRLNITGGATATAHKAKFLAELIALP